MSHSDEIQYKFSDKISDYEFINLIGIGSFGRVHRGKCIVETPDGSEQTFDCAIKCIQKKSSQNIGKIYTEVSIHLRFKCPHILQLYNVIESGDNVYLILELCNGGTLANYVKQKVTNNGNRMKNVKFKGHDKNKICDSIVPYDVIRNVMKQICLGLDYLHRNAIVHRDLNLNNLLLVSPPDDNDNFTIKIADFGLAFDLNSSNQNNLTLKLHRDNHVIPMPAGTTICGTPGFISPEVWSQMQTVSPASDIFSLGSILFSLIAGHTPKGELDLSIYSPIAGDLISQLLAPDPNDRPSIESVLKHPFMIGPFSTERLSPINKLTKTIHLSIDENGSVKLNFLKSHSTIHISKSGHSISVSNNNGKEKTFTLETLPSSHWKKYIYALKFVELVKAKTPKVTVHCGRDYVNVEKNKCNKLLIKGCLMENGDFEMTFLDTINDNLLKMLFNNNMKELDNDLLNQTFKLRDRCLHIEKQMTQMNTSLEMEYFPVTIGRKYKLKNADNIQDSVVPPSTVSSQVLRSAHIRGIGVASQLSNGVIHVTFADGSSLSIANNSQIIYSSQNGMHQRFNKHDSLPEFVRDKLALLPHAIDELRHSK